MQTKKDSFKEASVNTTIGLVISFASTSVIMPMFGYDYDAAKFGMMTICFTLVSVVRTYIIRRYFNKK
jgi:hypothetical protein